MTKIAYVPYSANPDKNSRWGGMDFDAHDGNEGRAITLARHATRIALQEHADLAVILESSGGEGFHLWLIANGFRAIDWWISTLKKIAKQIGAPLTTGVCEIFPPDSANSRFGRGMRAPGAYNPRTDTFSTILFQTCDTLLGELRKHGNQLTRSSNFPDTKKQNSFSSSEENKFLEGLVRLFPILAPATRNEQLVKLTGHVFNQIGHDQARDLARTQFERKMVRTRALVEEHLHEFESAWKGLESAWREQLSRSEEEVFDNLEPGPVKEAFRIVRSFAVKARAENCPDFPIVRDNLAQRIGVTGKGAAWVRDKLEALGVIRKTTDYVPNKAAARFSWLL